MPIRDLLHMSSGVAFGEDEDGGGDLDRLWLGMMRGLGSVPHGTVNSIAQFNQRVAAPGTRFHYASIEAPVLGVVLTYATGKTLSDYLQGKLWTRIGTEADAAWLVGNDGFLVAHSFFNAVLRDYARLARLLAHDGAWDGRQVIPAGWMLDATTVRAGDAYLAPGRTSPGSFGYGYLVWLLPGVGRQFALIGSNGQHVLIDPGSKLVLVQTAVAATGEVFRLWVALVGQFGRT